MKNGFFVVSCAAPGVVVADVAANTESIIEQARAAYAGGADALVFPEMCVYRLHLRRPFFITACCSMRQSVVSTE